MTKKVRKYEYHHGCYLVKVKAAFEGGALEFSFKTPAIADGMGNLGYALAPDAVQKENFLLFRAFADACVFGNENSIEFVKGNVADTGEKYLITYEGENESIEVTADLEFLATTIQDIEAKRISAPELVELKEKHGILMV